MQNKIFIIASMAFTAACNNSANKDVGMADSLGNKYTDTTRRGDTAYYERMHPKTGAADSTSINPQRRSDTAYYERLPNKTNPPDSSR